MFLRCSHFGHVMKNKTLFNIYFRMMEQNNFQTIRFSLDYEYAVLVNFLNYRKLWRSLAFYVIIKVWVIFRCYAYSSTDNFLSSLLVSNWVIFFAEIWYFIRKRNKNYKNTIFLWKTTKKCHKSICKHKVAFFTLNLSHCPVMLHAPNLRDTEKI